MDENVDRTHGTSDTPGQKEFPSTAGTLDRALSMVEYLRTHCPWDRRQTARSLVPHLLEETHEVVDAIHSDDPGELLGELGDLLLNLAFQVVVAEESGFFTRDEMVDHLEEKMVRRHPHLFGGEPESWDAIKARERLADAATRAGEADGEGIELTSSDGPVASGVLDGLASGLDPLLRAHRIQEKVSGVGFDWEDASGALEKVHEELSEVVDAMEASDSARISEEMGDLLFSVVNLARLAGVHAVTSLEAANLKFRRRFESLEELARERDVDLPGAPLEALDELWDEVKRREAARDG